MDLNKFRARELRSNQTDAEKHLWNCLRNRRINGYKFRRQYCLGKYIIDFISLEKNLIVEIDGGQHQEQIYYDNERSLFLKKSGFKVIRFWNNEVLQQLNGVLEKILEHLEDPHPTLSHKNGRGELPQALQLCRY